MSGILEGKRILITGVLTEASIAFHTAKLAQEQGAEVILTAFPRPTLTERIAKKLPKPTKVIELDVTNDEHLGRGGRAPCGGRRRAESRGRNHTAPPPRPPQRARDQ
ncbi:SDR family oxidoreductase, partial [Streptomyces massasporeus]|uniref:SDR family oxidoreductase n=1 Tax=Streptomyces massasporeus TaxID=67324 RepID=UPI00368B0511